MSLLARTRAGERLLEAQGTLMERALAFGLPVASSCSGQGSCARCLFSILEGEVALSPMGEHEARVLVRNGVQPGVRLACQTSILNGHIPVVITTGYW